MATSDSPLNVPNVTLTAAIPTVAAPSAPPVFTTTADSTSVTASVTNPNGATSYNIRVDGGVSQSGLTVTGLTTGQTYSVELQGVNSAGSSAWSAGVSTTTSQTPVGGGVPAYYIPSVLKFISWDAPVLAHTGVDIDYKMTAYDWSDRDLTWSVSGPTGMTIDADGTLHWTPSTDLTTESVTVTCSLGGQENLSKTFNCVVDNSRCYFVSTTGADTNPGTLASPFLTFEKAAGVIDSATTGRNVYMRGGTYNHANWDWFSAELGGLPDKTSWTETNPFLFRNYPGEEVLHEIASGSGPRLYQDHNIVYGQHFNGGTTTEAGACVLSGRSVGKRVKASNYQSNDSGNCTGFRTRSGTILDQCQAWDNYDRTPSIVHNSSNYLSYGTGGVGDYDTYIIDCLSDGLSGRSTPVGFKLKHAGELAVHWHKCVDIGEQAANFAGFGKQLTIRHCTFAGTSGTILGLYRTDETTLGINNTNEGWLTENNLIIANGGGSGILLTSNTDAPMSQYPPIIKGNTIVSSNSTMDGNVFRTWGSSMPVGWDIDFSDNNIYTNNAANSVDLFNVIGPLSDITDYGTDNQVLPSAQDYTFSAAGRTFQFSGNTLSEVL